MIQARVSIQTEDFDLSTELAALRAGDARVGAVCSFVGTVRGASADAPPLLTMELEHYPGMTEKSILAMVDEAHRRFDIYAKQLPRRLFCNAIRQSLLLVTGGWRQLDLSPLQDLAPCWTQTGTPTLFLSMHHGNWEWLAGILYHLRKDSLGVARAAHQRPGQILLDHVRSFHRTPVLYNQAGTRAAHRTLRRGGLVAFLADQRPPTQGEMGTWMGQPTRVSPLPRLWCRGIQPDLWTGDLLPMSTSYRLTLRRYPSEAIAHWDKLLDQDFAPLVAQSPEWHFGLFHRRLVPPGTPT